MLELEKRVFLDNYGLGQDESEEDIRKLLNYLSNSDKSTMETFIKNILAIRIMDSVIAEHSSTVKNRETLPLVDVFGKRHINDAMVDISRSLDVETPEMVLSKKSCLVAFGSTLLWAVAVLIFIQNRLEILLSGVEILVWPFILIIVMAPFMILRFVFPSFFAPSHYPGINTFEDLIDSIYSRNETSFADNNFGKAISEFFIIHDSIFSDK